MRDIQVRRLKDEAILPTRTHITDGGLDMYALEDVFLPINKTIVIKTGCALRIPEGYIGKIEDRSGTAVKGLRTGGGVIDYGYSGDVGIIMHNINNATTLYNYEQGYWVSKGDKIAQVIILKIELPEVREVNFLWDSSRGAKGFNSSGI